MEKKTFLYLQIKDLKMEWVQQSNCVETSFLRRNTNKQDWEYIMRTMKCLNVAAWKCVH